LGSTEAEKGFPMKDSGAERRPTNSESEKLRVARVARNMPSRSREKEWSSRWCCGVSGAWLWIRMARRLGRTRISIVNTAK